MGSDATKQHPTRPNRRLGIQQVRGTTAVLHRFHVAHASGRWINLCIHCSDCPLLDCFYGTAPTVVLDVDGSDVTFYGENNLDKLLYGCNKETITPVPSPVEVKVEGENFSGCYCCHTAPCDCSSFQNANAYEVLVSVAPVASISSLSPSVGPSAGTPVTITGKDFVNTSGLACKFGSQVVSAAFVSATQIMCSAPATLAPGVTHVPVSVTNLGSKWSTASTFSYDATNPGAKLYVGSGLLNSVKNALLPVLESMLTNMKVDYFAGSDSVMVRASVVDVVHAH